MAARSNVLITFDYELFQGRKSGTVDNCVLRPTAQILEILARHRAKAIFFIDMLYVVRLKEAAEKYPKARYDFDRISGQLIEMANAGHYVFNHLHPHWLDAVYNADDNQWELNDASKYSFELLTIAEKDYVFEKTTDLLAGVLQISTDPQPQDGFRAGGLYIQPFQVFKPYFDRYKLKYDFSVLRYATGELENKRSQFDFRSVSKSIYRFNSAVEREDKNGPYTEYALDSAEILFARRLMNSLFFRVSSRFHTHQRFGDGLSSSNKMHNPARRKYAVMETFSVEMLNEIKMPVYLAKARKTNYLHLLSHPKLISPYTLKMFDRLLSKLTAIGQLEYDFKKFEIDN